MRISARGSVDVACRAWRGGREPMVTVVARVTYELTPVRAALAPPEPVRTRDRWVEGERRQSYVHEPSDLAPYKENADVVVVGKAYAPGPSPVTEVAARVVIGDIDKTVRVTGPRRFGRDGAALAPSPFHEAPIDWTRAAGGDGSWNPVGVGDREPADLRGETPAPTVIPYDVDAPARGGYVAPAGFGPIAPRWAPRREVMPDDAAAWIDPDAAAALAWSGAARTTFFQCAPSDQRLPRPIRADERIVLENLSAQHPRLVTNLPGLPLRAVVALSGGDSRPIDLHADTLWIDTERGIATVTHRASLPAAAVESGELFVWLEGEPATEPRRPADTGAAASGVGRETVALPIDLDEPSDDEGGEWGARGTAAVNVPPGGGAQLPFGGAGRRSIARTAPARPLPGDDPAPPPFRSGPGGATPAPGVALRGPAAAAPVAAPATVLAPAAVPSGASPPAAALVAPPLAPPPPGPSPRPSWPGIQPSGPVANVAAPAPVRLGAAPAAAAAPSIDTWKLHEQAAARRAPDDAAPAPAAPPTGERRDAASGPAAAVPPAKRVAVEVVWFDSTAEVEAASRAKTLLDQLGDDGDGELMAPRDAGAGTFEVARRDVRRWMTRAAPIELDDLQDVMIGALEDDRPDRPYVVVAGELAWSFDPRETLRAWIALGAPLAVDPRVKDALEAAERASAESAVAMPEVLGAAADRLRDAVRASARVVGNTPIETAAERWLVEERGFGRRRVWGQLRLRAHLHAKGARAPLPVYLPDGAGLESPLAQRFPVRLVGELRSRQDPTEAATVCLRAVALGVEITQ